ncbi:MAG: helix-turn-helix domain-containing protein [Candidatus Saccharimonadales bacterium]
MSDGDRPFRILGWHLKLAREQLSESVAEVSGAVEIDTEELERIELGRKRPSEDILMLLISHLGLADVEASSLWELAGYVSQDSNSGNELNKSDLRILYTDLIHMAVNDSGVVINFLQSGAIGNQPLSVARVGMSKTQAKQMLKLLQHTLGQSKALRAKNLPAQKRVADESKKDKKQTN